MRLWIVVALAACGHGHDEPYATCPAVADHVFALMNEKDEHARRVHDAFAHHCADDAWPRAAMRCMLDEPHLRAGHGCKRMLGDVQRERLERELAEIDESRVPKTCVLFRDAVDKLGTCDKAAQVMPTQREAYARIKGKIDGVTRATAKDLAEECDAKLAQVEQLSHAVGCEAKDL